MQISDMLIITSIVSFFMVFLLRNKLVIVYFLAQEFYFFSSLVALNKKVDYEYVNNIYIIQTLSFSFFILIIYLLFSRKKIKMENMHFDGEYIIDNKVGRYCVLGVMILALVAFSVLVLQYGIPALNTGIRYKVSGYVSYSVFSLWIVFPFAFIYLNKRMLLFYFLISASIFTLMAYRTPIVILFIMLFILNHRIKRYKFSVKLYSIVSGSIFFILAIYPIIRYDDMGILENIADNLGIPKYLVSMMPFFIATTEGSEVLTGIRNVIFEHGPQMGSFTMGGMLTFLPGFDLHSRRLLSMWLGRSNWQESTTTSTLVGQFMIEFGYSGVILCSLFLSIFLILSFRYFYRSNNVFSIATYIIFYILLLLSIHTGFLDPIIIYAVCIYVFFIFVINRKNVKIF